MKLPRPFSKTSTAVGVLFYSLALSLGSCKEQPSQNSADLNASASKIDTSPDTEPDHENQAAQPLKTSTGPYRGTRVMFYNVRNYLKMDRRVKGKHLKSQPKPANEISALIEIIKSTKPDILGLCEIGGKAELQELQKLLKNAGLDLPHSELVEAWDRNRRLALLSKFPITKRLSQTDLKYPIQGRKLTISRGILDVIIDVNGEPLELLVAHLKSKREIKKYNQAEMRRNEAKLIRQRMSEILDKDADAKFAVMGDFNDTSKTPAIETIRGRYNTPKFCDYLDLKASNGTYWTQFWSWQHVYSRFDYIFVSPSLALQVDEKKSRIIDHPKWAQASDHRAVLMVLK